MDYFLIFVFIQTWPTSAPPPSLRDFLLSPRGEVETDHTFPPDIPGLTREHVQRRTLEGSHVSFDKETNKKVQQLTDRNPQT